MYRIPSLLLVLLLATATAALAQFPPQPPPPSSPGQGNEQERAACHPDVVKFCKAELAINENDTFAILGCLQRNRARISAACRKVLEDHGQ